MADETRAERAARTAAPHRRPRPAGDPEGVDERVAAEVARRLAGAAVKARPSLPTLSDDPVLDPEQRIPPRT